MKYDGKDYLVALGPRSLPQGAPTSPAITNTLCLRLDRRLTGLANKLGWRYSRYADDLTFSLPDKKLKKGPTARRSYWGVSKKLSLDEGFVINPSKTRVARKGGRQAITGLIVNGKEGPRVPREKKRELRAAIHNLKQGKGLKEGESLESLAGYAAYIYMTEPKLGAALLAALEEH